MWGWREKIFATLGRWSGKTLWRRRQSSIKSEAGERKSLVAIWRKAYQSERRRASLGRAGA